METEMSRGLNGGGIGCTQSLRYQLNDCTLGLLAVAMDTSQRRSERPGEFSRRLSSGENCQMTSSAAVTVVTALTSDEWRCCRLQVDTRSPR